MKSVSLLCLGFFVFCSPCRAWEGTVMDVHDGDTITLAPGGARDTPIAIRLYGIDAPELAQKYGITSRDALRRMLPRESIVQVIPMGMDRYGRSTGLVIHAGQGINAAMLREGQAWLYKRSCRAKFYRHWLKEARNAQNQKKDCGKAPTLWLPGFGEPRRKKPRNEIFFRTRRCLTSCAVPPLPENKANLLQRQALVERREISGRGISDG